MAFTTAVRGPNSMGIGVVPIGSMAIGIGKPT